MKRTIAEAFNEWMRRYIETPERFNREFESIVMFRAEVAYRDTPTYGEKSAAYLQSLMDGN